MITATVNNDASSRGVMWSISPASGSGTLTNSTAFTTNYAAPATPPSSDLMVTITATSATDPAKSASVNVDLAVISVSVTASVGTVSAGGTSLITAVVNSDTSNKGVTWSISPASGAGTLSNSTAFTTTYNAPATPPSSSVTVKITATAVVDPLISGPVSITLAAISVSLTASVTEVQAGSTSLITATVSSDPLNAGVSPASWAITSPASGGGTLSNPTSTSVTYTAPTTLPASDVQVTISATSASSSAASGSVTITFAAIAVSLSANPSSVQAAATSQITAMVTFDPSNAGVNPTSWAITSPSSGGGTLSNQTSTSVSYTAPSTPPASNLTVTISATSQTDSRQSSSTTITVLAITVSISPGSALIPMNVALSFTPTIQYDPANAGVNWTVTQSGTPCSTCGTFSAANTANGTPTTYTAPAAVPTPATVTVTATSVTDTTKSASATITVTDGTVEIVPATLNFGDVKTNFTKSATTTLTNTGTTALSITSITFTKSSFSLNGDTCGTSVAAASSCNLTVTFKPLSPIGYGAGMNISDSSADSPQQVTLTGTGENSRFAEAVLSALAANKFPSSPPPTGSDLVGTVVLDLVDPTRNDPFLANGAKREVLVRLWYPASPGQSCIRADYASPAVWSDFSRLMGIPLPQVTTNSCSNASMSDGAHPVVIFTHGYTGTFTDYTFLFEDLASRGYVVASVDHTFEATAVEFPDGRLVESVFGSHFTNTARADEQSVDYAVSVRLDDLQFVVNALESLNAAESSMLAGKLDMSRLALAGHSLGGWTAILGVEQDSRFRAGIILDDVVPDSPLSGTDTPMLLLAAGRETWSKDELRLWSGLRGPRIAVNLRGTEHVTPTDAVWLAMGAIKTGSMGPQKTITAVRRYVAAFLDANLLGKPVDPLLTGPSAEYPDAIVTTRQESLRAHN